MKEPVDHILRPRLPWRSPAEPAITECGYDASKVKALPREEFFKRFKELGQQRCALLTCMTCSDTARRWPTWEEDPRKALEREIAWEGNRWRADRGTRLLDELKAIAVILSTHAEEFATIMQRQSWIDRKNAARPERSVARPDGPKPL